MKREINRFKYALEGIYKVLWKEVHGQFHFFAAGLSLILAAYLSFTTTEWCILIFSIVLILALEAVNTAIEKICNLVHPDYHPLVKQAKDVGAGAVLIAAIGVFCIGCMLFLPKLWALI